MKTELRVERTFSLGNYQNIRVTAAIDEIPLDQFSRKEVRDALVEFMLVNIERIFMQYVDMRQKLSNLTYDEIVRMLSEQYEKSNADVVKFLVDNGG